MLGYYREQLGGDGPFICEVELSSVGLIIRQLGSETTHPWPNVASATEVSGGIEFIYRPMGALLVRDRAFQTPESRQQFLTLALQLIPHGDAKWGLTICWSDRGPRLRWAEEWVDDLDQSASFGAGEASRRSASSLDWAVEVASMPKKTPTQQLAGFLAKYDPAVAIIARAALERLRKRLPWATEIVYDNYNALAVGFGPGDRTSEAIFSIAVYPRWVSLFFLQGARLKDPAKLLKGSGTKVRHIVLGEGRDIDSGDVDALIAAALVAAVRPIDPKAKRQLIIKSVSAKQRPRRPV
jgi:hypothetical protein